MPRWRSWLRRKPAASSTDELGRARGRHHVGVRGPSARRRLRGSRRSRGCGRLLRSGRFRESGRVASSGRPTRSAEAGHLLWLQGPACRMCGLPRRSNVDAQDPLSCESQGDERSSRGWSACTSITPSANSPPANSRINSQPTAGPVDALRIDAPLEAVGRRAVQIQLPGGGADRERGEVGRFDQQIGRVAAETSVSAPPITPPRATGRELIGDHAHPGLARRTCWWSIAVKSRRAGASRTMISDARRAWRNRTRAAAGRTPSAHSS